MSESLEKGWINRQISRMSAEYKMWPEWMRREAELRARRIKEEIDTHEDRQSSDEFYTFR